jgi:hypothetical protein
VVCLKHEAECLVGERQRKNVRREAVAACFGVGWRAAVDEDGQYSFAVLL